MSASEMFEQLRRPAKHDFKVGDIVDWDWDLDQVNPPIRCRIVRLGLIERYKVPGAELEMIGSSYGWDRSNQCAPLGALTLVEPAAPAEGEVAP